MHSKAKKRQYTRHKMRTDNILESARHRGAHVISQNQPPVVLVAVLHTLVQQHRWYGPQNPLHHCQVHVIVGEIEHW